MAHHRQTGEINARASRRNAQRCNARAHRIGLSLLAAHRAASRRGMARCARINALSDNRKRWQHNRKRAAISKRGSVVNVRQYVRRAAQHHIEK